MDDIFSTLCIAEKKIHFSKSCIVIDIPGLLYLYKACGITLKISREFRISLILFSQSVTHFLTYYQTGHKLSADEMFRTEEREEVGLIKSYCKFITAEQV